MTVIKRLARKQAHGGSIQKEYADHFVGHLRQASGQIIGEFGSVVGQIAGEVLEIYEDKIGVDDDMRVRHLIVYWEANVWPEFPLTRVMLRAIESEWLRHSSANRSWLNWTVHRYSTRGW